jgi:hypothetical protein
VTAKAHGGSIDIQGVTIAHLSDKHQVTKLETWFDPVEMFRQIAPEGIVKKEVAAAAAAAGCPVMAHQAAASNTSSVKEMIKDLEQHSIDVKTPDTDSKSKPGGDAVLDTARKAGKAVVDGQARLGPEKMPSEANPADGDIPRANAE